MSGLLIAAPLRLEALMISCGRPPARVRITGMGARRARAAVPALLGDPGEALLVMGFGGGLREDSEVGDVVVAEEVLAFAEDGSPDGAAVVCAGADPLALALERHGLRVRRGVVASVGRIALGETRARLRESGAIAVDMESAWLAPAAGGRPFAVIRVLSDTPARELARRLPAVRPLPAAADGLRAAAALRRAAGAVDELVRARGVHTVFGADA